MNVRYERARVEDYDEVIDFGNYVFSQAHAPHDFPALLPKLYRRGSFMDGAHYVAREDGRIKAAVGVYPLELNVGGAALPGRGIGMVSVHPYCRGRGHMRALMAAALDDMKRDGAVFSCLGGQRQRYEYFGYTPAGLSYRFDCNAANIRHTLGREFKTVLSIKQIGPEDTDALDRIRGMHESKAAYMTRRNDRFFDILTSWKSRVFAIMEDAGDGRGAGQSNGQSPRQHLIGYLLCSADGGEIHEINIEARFGRADGLTRGDGARRADGAGRDDGLGRDDGFRRDDGLGRTVGVGRQVDDSIMRTDALWFAEAIGLFLRTRNSAGEGGSVTVAAQPHETEKLAALSRFAERYRQSAAYSFAVFNYPRFVLPFMKLKSSYRTLADGTFTLGIEDGPRLALAVSNGEASVSETTGPAALSLGGRDAVRFLFSPDSAASSDVIGRNPFLQSLFPLPLSIETADEV
jgi:predicted N-acetyltransferase YhbS